MRNILDLDVNNENKYTEAWTNQGVFELSYQ